MIGLCPACLDIALRLYVVVHLWIGSTPAPWAQDLSHNHQIKTSMYNYRSFDQMAVELSASCDVPKRVSPGALSY